VARQEVPVRSVQREVEGHRPDLRELLQLAAELRAVANLDGAGALLHRADRPDPRRVAVRGGARVAGEQDEGREQGDGDERSGANRRDGRARSRPSVRGISLDLFDLILERASLRWSARVRRAGRGNGPSLTHIVYDMIRSSRTYARGSLKPDAAQPLRQCSGD